MKKIRLLAILLAILMIIPFGMFVACDDDTDDNGDDTDGDGTTDDVGDDDTSSGPSHNVVYDDDGTNADGGYLMYFHFNAAKAGMLDIVPPSTDTTKPESAYQLNPPYSSYLEGTLVNGGCYTVRKDGQRSFLAMERRDVAGSPTIKIKVDEALASDIDADHMIQFDVLFDDGMFGSPIDIYGTKNAGKSKYTFASIENGAIKDGNGTVVYGDKDTDKDGWITVSILIAEQNRTYDIYVDGVKQTNGAAMPSVDSYPAWTSYKPFNYCIGVRNQGNADTFFFMDNLCMKNGNEATLGIYKGEDSLGVYYTSVPSYENKVVLTKQGVLDFIGTSNSMLNVSPFGSSKLLLANALSLTKIGSDDGMDVLEDLMIDYGAETGAYTDGAISIFENGNAYIKAWLEVDPEDEDYAVYDVATKGYIVYDNDKTDAVEPVEGTYTVTGEIITVEWDADAAPVFGDAAVSYLKYDTATSTVSIYADAAAATKVDGADFVLYKATEAYAYTYYANIGEGDKYTLRIDPFLGIASLKVVGADGTTEGEYPYTVDGSTVTVNSLAFNYNEEDNTFTVGETVLNKVVESIELAEDEKLAVKWTNFKTGAKGDLKYIIDNKWWKDNRHNYDTFVFEFYASEEMVNDGFEFLVQFYCGKSVTIDAGKTAYYHMTLNPNKGNYRYKQGWNRFEVVIEETAVSRDPNIENLEFIDIIVSGWSCGPAGDTDVNTRDDGYTMYISKLAFTKNTSLELKGPDLGKERCEHQSELGEDLFVKVEQPIPGNCLHGDYYVEECSECHMTRLDTSKPIGEAGGHTLTGEQKYLVPTCDTEGYYYIECEDCGFHAIQEKVAAKGHNYHIDADWNARIVTYYCVACGDEYAETIYEELVPLAEKANTVPLRGGFLCNGVDNTNVNITADSAHKSLSVTSISGKSMNVGGPLRRASIKTAFAGGRNCVEITHLGQGTADSQHTYWSLGLPSRENYDFVIDFDIMLGKKQKDGTYINGNVQVVERTNGSRDFYIFSWNDEGVAKLGSVRGTPTGVQLSDSKFTNVAVCFSSTKNTVALYVDGYFVDELPFNNGNFPQASMVKSGELRLNMESGGDIAGASTYFAGLLVYETDEPGCVITDIPVTEEATGPIVLKDTVGNPMNSSFDVKFVDVKTSLGVDVFSTKYVLEFTLNGTDLADGTILRGTSRATGFDRYEDLITVKGGKVYFGNRLISDTTENVKIALACDDTVGTVTIYVNGTALEGVESYTNPVYCVYGDVQSYLRTLTFLKECGEYSISGLAMYTGNTVNK